MEIRSLVDTDFDTLALAFERAFAEYDTQWNKEELRRMLRRRGFDPRCSFAAFDEGEIAAFTLNGTGEFDGRPTAYDTGTGTLKAYRGQGLATRIFEYSIPHLQAAGIERYLLEVLQHNTPAVSVYRRLGFETTREFHYFRQDRTTVGRKDAPSRTPYDIRTMEAGAIDRLAELAGCRDFRPSWQNDLRAVRRAPEDFVVLGAFDCERLIGYCITEPASGDITQIGVLGAYRRRGIGSQLLRRALAVNRSDTVKIINTEIGCTALTDFLAAWNIRPAGQQFEMVKQLR